MQHLQDCMFYVACLWHGIFIDFPTNLVWVCVLRWGLQPVLFACEYCFVQIIWQKKLSMAEKYRGVKMLTLVPKFVFVHIMFVTQMHLSLTSRDNKVIIFSPCVFVFVYVFVSRDVCPDDSTMKIWCHTYLQAYRSREMPSCSSYVSHSRRHRWRHYVKSKWNLKTAVSRSVSIVQRGNKHWHNL